MSTAKSFLKFSKCFPAETVLAQWADCVADVLQVDHPSLGSPRSPSLLKKPISQKAVCITHNSVNSVLN